MHERFPGAPTSLQTRISEIADAMTLRNLHKVIVRASSVQDIEQVLR